MDPRHEITIPVNESLVRQLERALTRSDRGRGRAATMVAEEVHGVLALPQVRAGVAKGQVTLDVFTWDVYLVVLARSCVAQPDPEMQRTALSLRSALLADPGYAALRSGEAEYERHLRKLSRIRSRAERDRRILAEYDRTHDPHRALRAGLVRPDQQHA